MSTAHRRGVILFAVSWILQNARGIETSVAVLWFVVGRCNTCVRKDAVLRRFSRVAKSDTWLDRRQQTAR
jgi:hypothetical protein